MGKELTRRGFLQTAAGAAGLMLAAKAIALPEPAYAQQWADVGGEKIKFGIIGIGMQGSGLLANAVTLPGVECIAAVRHGFVPDVVADIVKNSGAGRLILGTHGRRGLKKFVLGSVARQLLETVDVPVCTVGPRAHKRAPETPGTILHPVSLAGMHESSAALSIGLGQQFGAQVLLFHVITSSPAVARDPAAAVAAATAELEKLVPRQALSWTRVQAKVASGNIVQEILNAAQETQAGLIVLGVHAPAHSWLPGTEPAAYKILVSAPCPVISLKVSPLLAEDNAENREHAGPVVLG